MTLQDITGRESGIVLYESSREAIVCNWAGVDGLPRLDPLGMFVVGLGENIEAPEYTTHIAEMREYTDGYDVIYNRNGDALEGAGTVYYLPDGVFVITPDDWN